MKQNYGKVFNPGLNSYDSSRAIVETIQTDVALAKSCGQVG
jgi:hypothetical protein